MIPNDIIEGWSIHILILTIENEEHTIMIWTDHVCHKEIKERLHAAFFEDFASVKGQIADFRYFLNCSSNS